MLSFQGTYVEGIKEEVVLSPGHALSFIAAGEGTYTSSCVAMFIDFCFIFFQKIFCITSVTT